MSWNEWRPYVPVAQRRRQAEQKLKKLKKKGQAAAPVTIEGRTIARSFWGKSWCTNLERYSDYENRLPRGRTYVRNGSVVDLQIAKGEVLAFVSGSELYKIRIEIAPVAAKRWKAICRDCTGTIDSLVELLQGRLAAGVMERMCREGDGLFPAPHEIKLSCSCPDWAGLCKHVAATLYGVGARLDERPELLFVLRGVHEKELIAGAERDLSLGGAVPSATQLLDENDVVALFGLEMADTTTSEAPAARGKPRPSPKMKAATSSKAPSTGRPTAGMQPAAPKAADERKSSRGKPRLDGASTAKLAPVRSAAPSPRVRDRRTASRRP